MSVAGVLGLFRARPQQPVGADGRMALVDHLRELRARLLRVVLMLVVGIVIAWFFYEQLFALLLGPYRDAQETLVGKVDTDPVITGAASALLLQLKICGLTAVVLGSPYWLFQIWGFIVPGLHAHEKKWTRVFAAVAGPLFIAGCAVGYYVLPKGLEVLLSFTPADIQSFVEFGDYFRFFTRMLLVFGVAFEIPLFVLMLNLAGVVSGKTLGAYRPWIVVGTFVFAAGATPSTDPFSMIMLAAPMTVLFLVSECLSRLIDRRRGGTSYHQLDDDEASSIDGPSDVDGVSDVRRSRLDDED